MGAPMTRGNRGDSAAFAELYETYSPQIFRFLRRRMEGSDEIVEDLTEDGLRYVHRMPVK